MVHSKLSNSTFCGSLHSNHSCPDNALSHSIHSGQKNSFNELYMAFNGVPRHTAKEIYG